MIKRIAQLESELRRCQQAYDLDRKTLWSDEEVKCVEALLRGETVLFRWETELEFLGRDPEELFEIEDVYGDGDMWWEMGGYKYGDVQGGGISSISFKEHYDLDMFCRENDTHEPRTDLDYSDGNTRIYETRGISGWTVRLRQ